MADSTTTKMPCSQFGCSYPSQMMLHGGGSCCDSVRQIHDGLPGHSVCPCQFDRVLQHRVASVPVNVLPRPPFNDAGFSIGSGTVSAFYSPLARACDLKESAQPWRDSWYLTQASRTPFELHGFDPHTHAACSRFAERFSPIDLAAAGARRKNATRETTSTLKAWLYEHRKNPYPTKGEKIMLAILTKMTLTQVSTWFANARRRLKKENKMTWSPRNRCGEKKDGMDGSDVDDDGDLDINSDDEDKLFDKHDSDKIDIEEIECKEEGIEGKEGKEITDCNDNTDTKPTRGIERSASTDSSGLTRPKIINTPAVVTIQRSLPTPRPIPSAAAASVLVVSTPSPVEDSPVKSLRKWVDGCFHNTTTTTTGYTVDSASLVTRETPPTTPPQRTSTETPVITSAPSSNSVIKLERRGSDEDKRKTVSMRNDACCDRKKEPTKIKAALPLETRHSEATNYREIDAALALTTLSSR